MLRFTLCPLLVVALLGTLVNAKQKGRSATFYRRRGDDKVTFKSLNESLSNCEYAPGLSVTPNQNRTQCCDKVYNNFLLKWGFGISYLSSFLETLQGWNCSQFKEQCQLQTFAFNDFTRLTYARFCDHSALEKECTSQVIDAASGNGQNVATSWNDAVRSLDVLRFTANQIENPCLQVAMYERDEGGFGYYHEIISPFVPFCSFVWCGMDERLISRGEISVSTCMPQSCRTSIIIMMVFCAILAVLVTFANATVLCTLIFKKETRHSQAIYRFSLALADILVGIFVFPTFISSLSNEIFSTHELGELKNVSGYVMQNGTVFPDQVAAVEVHGSADMFSRNFPRSYLNFVGFFTVLSLSLSVFTLVAAAIDRCIALRFAARYKKKSKVPVALIVTLCLWVLAIILSLLPLMVPLLRYSLVASVLVSSAGPEVLVLYSVAFFVPLVLMWIATLYSFVTSRRFIARWRKMSAASSANSDINEARLAKTLGIMVGVFTLSLLPAAIVMLTALFIPSIYVVQPFELDQQTSSTYLSAEVVVLFILMCNSLWNCFIYSARDQVFRKAALEMYASVASKAGLRYFERLLIKNVRTAADQDQDNSGDGIISNTRATEIAVNGQASGSQETESPKETTTV